MVDLFQSTVNLNLSLSNVQYVLNATTVLTVMIPPQPTFNIAKLEEIRLAMTPSLLASRSTIASAVKMLYIRTVPTPRCNLSQPYDITACVFGRDLTILHWRYNDTFCNLLNMYTDVLPYSFNLSAQYEHDAGDVQRDSAI